MRKRNPFSSEAARSRVAVHWLFALRPCEKRLRSSCLRFERWMRSPLNRKAFHATEKFWQRLHMAHAKSQLDRRQNAPALIDSTHRSAT